LICLDPTVAEKQLIKQFKKTSRPTTEFSDRA